MVNRLKAIFNSRETVFAMLIIQFCLVCLVVNLQHSKAWTGPATAASLGGGIVLAAWLCWFAYVVITKKPVLEITGNAKRLTDTIDILLFLYWMASMMFPAIAFRWMILVSLAAVVGCITYTTLTSAKTNS